MMLLRPDKAVSSVVLLSGGLDSAANLAICDHEKKPTMALTVNYGQRAAGREFEAARSLCDYYDVELMSVDVPWLGQLGGNSLTDSSRNMPELTAEQLDQPKVTQDSARAVWVPNRNGVLIHIAAAFAERRGAAEVIVGFNREEAATFPDNSLEYIHKVNEALAYSTANGVKVRSYTVEWDKPRIVKELRKLPRTFPFERLWSCYYGDARPCGRCESCRRLARALES